MKYRISIEGMMCGHCTSRVNKALGSVRGVLGVDVSLDDKCATVEVKERVKPEALKVAVENEGYTVTGVDAL